MRNRLILILLFSMANTIVYSCKNNLVLIGQKDLSKINIIAVDKLGYFYEIDNLNQIKKYNSDAKLLFTYSNAYSSSVSTIDVSNPHKTMVFYYDQQVILFLDNTLSEISRIELDPSSSMAAAGMSNDGNIWLFDANKRRLIKIDKSGSVIDESFPLNELNPDDISNRKIIENDNYVMIPLNNKTIYLFDNQGYFIRKLLLGYFRNPVIVNNKIYYLDKKNNTYSIYDLKYNQKKIIMNFSSRQLKPDQVILENNKFNILQNNKIIIIPLPDEFPY